MLNLMFTNKAKLSNRRLTFLVLRNGIVPIGYAESFQELLIDSSVIIPLQELRGAGFVNEETGIIEFTGTAFGTQIYPDHMVNKAASQASLALEIAGAALRSAQANESAYRKLADQLKAIADLCDKIAQPSI